MKILPIFSSLLLFGLLSHATAAAAGAECYRNSDCAGESLCLDLECITPSESLESCKTDYECEYHEFCHDEFCKPEGVACSNVVGNCVAEEGWGECHCVSGPGIDWQGEGAVPDDELYEACVTALEAACGDGYPDVDDYCVDQEQIDACEDLYAKFAVMDEICNGETVDENFPTPFQIVACCEELNDADVEYGYFEFLIDCMMPLENDDCDALEDCVNGQQGGDDEDSGNDDAGEVGGGASGCGVTDLGGTGNNGLIFTLMALVTK